MASEARRLIQVMNWKIGEWWRKEIEAVSGFLKLRFFFNEILFLPFCFPGFDGFVYVIGKNKVLFSSKIIIWFDICCVVCHYLFLILRNISVVYVSLLKLKKSKGN